MRNFWLEADIDGRATALAGGPRAKDGGMRIDIRQREDGRSVLAVTVRCFVADDGTLHTVVVDGEGGLLGHITTER